MDSSMRDGLQHWQGPGIFLRPLPGPAVALIYNDYKGQDMVEYALMLAIIVGIGWLIYKQAGLANSINNVFSNANSLMEAANSQSAGTTT